MGFLSWLFGQEKETDRPKAEQGKSDNKEVHSSSQTVSHSVAFPDLAFEKGEKEKVTAIITACISGNQTGVSYRIKSIKKVDPDREAIGLISTAIAAGDQDNRRFYVKNIQRVK